ncbi:MAG TPA: thioesterase family protein [Beijerinckiaceae bacterium]|jgi:4-hydroxybenzoyl-CoA thioesterase
MSRPQPTPLAALPQRAWRGPLRIRFSHCDPAGIVYFARYFDLLNGVVEDWFEAALGLSYAEFIGPRRTGLGYGHASIDYVAPSMVGDRLTAVPLVERIGTASLSLRVHLYCGEEPILLARLVIVTTSLDVHRAIPLPADLRAAVEAYQELCR